MRDILEPIFNQPAPETHLAEDSHPDDQAVDRFAAAMKAKLAQKREEGRGGWDDPEQCSFAYLGRLLVGTSIKATLSIFATSP